MLAVVRREWDGAVNRVEHLPIGFGAHHWAATRDGEPRLFVTLDRMTVARPAGTFEAAYAAAADLARSGLDFVHAGLAALTGRWTVAVDDTSVLSVTPWLDGTRPPLDGADPETLAMVSALRSAEPPAMLRRWRTVVPRTCAQDLSRRLAAPWDRGPHGEEAREAVLDRHDAVQAWIHEHVDLVTTAMEHVDDWVVTHGEPMAHNQLLTSSGRLLVDWESALLAPGERDTRDLFAAGVDLGSDPAMVRLFDLEWRLAEVDQYSTWFASPHTGTESDRVALDGLREELARA